MRTQPCSSIYILSIAAFTLHQRSVVTTKIRYQIPKLFTIWSFKKKCTDSCYSGTKVSITEDVLSAATESRRQWKGSFKVLKENNCYLDSRGNVPSEKSLSRMNMK